MNKTKHQKNFELLKKSFNLAYPVSLVLSIFAILIKSKIESMTPGFSLMKFAMVFFAYSTLLTTSVFFLFYKLKKGKSSIRE